MAVSKCHINALTSGFIILYYQYPHKMFCNYCHNTLPIWYINYIIREHHDHYVYNHDKGIIHKVGGVYIYMGIDIFKTLKIK